MWLDLPEAEREEYKRMILAFASLTEMFAQKANTEERLPVPILNSKYQETVFQKVFNASPEDIGNTSFDASLEVSGKKYLIGIKTFILRSKEQKIAQFKANRDEWSKILDDINSNSLTSDGERLSKDEIDEVNNSLYMELARKIALLRNVRISSSKANLQGFIVSDGQKVESVYHVLMPCCVDNQPSISVGELAYDEIDVNSIEVMGCTNKNNPTNFSFSDGNHIYKFTAADSQLLMSFDNKEIIIESWPVVYADDAYGFFADLADRLYKKEPKQVIQTLTSSVEESYCWSILNEKGEVELFSGYNGFFGVGSKLSKDVRKKKVDNLMEKYTEDVEETTKDYVENALKRFLMDPASDKESKIEKVMLRNEIVTHVRETGNENFQEDVNKLLYRPENEMYIPIPNSKKFHIEHPTFFVGKGICFNEKGGMETAKEAREFNLVFEPSGNKVKSFIAEDWGKAIESSSSMSFLGEWILRGVFQLESFQPLTSSKLKEVGINGLRLYKLNGSNDVHLQFIWIDSDNLPQDYWF